MTLKTHIINTKAGFFCLDGAWKISDGKGIVFAAGKDTNIMRRREEEFGTARCSNPSSSFHLQVEE